VSEGTFGNSELAATVSLQQQHSTALESNHRSTPPQHSPQRFQHFHRSTQHSSTSTAALSTPPTLQHFQHFHCSTQHSTVRDSNSSGPVRIIGSGPVRIIG
jgi:hypothetical protein